MGVDVLLYVETEVTPERLAEAEEYFYERSTVADRYEPEKGTGWKSLESEERDWLPGPRVVANLTCRYWGPGYERGDWPGIYGAIRLLQHLWPDAKVFYGGDTDDEGYEVTAEMLDEYWAHWLSPQGNNYREYMRRAFPRPSLAPPAPDVTTQAPEDEETL